MVSLLNRTSFRNRRIGWRQPCRASPSPGTRLVMAACSRCGLANLAQAWPMCCSRLGRPVVRRST
eukprot:5677808-Prymnesium_polylepis.1